MQKQKCVFKCSERAASPGLPLCKSHLREYSLEFNYIQMHAFVEEPRGLGPFLCAHKENRLYPRLCFKMDRGGGKKDTLRTLYLPTFRKNHVIMHSLSFKNFIGNTDTQCATIEAVPLKDLERYKRKRKLDAYDNIIEMQTEARNILSRGPPTTPEASRYLVKMIDNHQAIFRSSVFAETTTPADALGYQQEILTLNFPDFISTALAHANFLTFNMRNTVWPGVFYHLYPQKIIASTNVNIDNYFNCEFQANIGLVATCDIFPGQKLILKNKSLDLSEYLCFLPPADHPPAGIEQAEEIDDDDDDGLLF